MMTRAYHFVPATHALSNLLHRRLKIATFDDLNDPFELWAVAQPNQTLRRGLRRWKECMACDYGVLCFSRTWANPVLWSHYGDRHRGIALGFDINAEMVKEVTYTRSRPQFRTADESTTRTLLYTKHIDWQYEQELRVYTRLEARHSETGLYFGDFNESMVLREIIAGPLCTTTKHEIEAALRDQQAAIMEGRLAFGTFDVVMNTNGFRGT